MKKNLRKYIVLIIVAIFMIGCSVSGNVEVNGESMTFTQMMDQSITVLTLGDLLLLLVINAALS